MDITNTARYGIGQSLAKSFNCLTQNEYSLKTSFETVKKIYKTPTEFPDQSYRYL